MALVAMGLSGCVRPMTLESTASVPVPESPVDQVSLPEQPADEAAAEIPEELLDESRPLTLGLIVDIALRNSPETRASWAVARAAAAGAGAASGSRYPTVDVTASLVRLKQAFAGGSIDVQQTVYGPSLALTYLLLDFGGRKGEIESSRQALLAADWTHNATVQGIILDVEEAYYDYLEAKARLEAADLSLRESEQNREAAEVRHAAGVATIADVLQARTAYSQIELSRQRIDGELRSLLGALATSMGIPANTPLEVGVLPELPPETDVTAQVDDLIEQAMVTRPELAAARARSLEADSRIRIARSQGLPSVDLSGNAGRTFYESSTGSFHADNWSVTLLLSIPVFDGYRKEYELRRSLEEAAAARARAEGLRQSVVLDVWQSYQGVKTAAQQIATAGDLLASAEESERVALARYKEGVGSILDLLSAQAVLGVARSEEIQARSAWFVSVARLSHDIGVLEPPAGSASGEAMRGKE